MKRYTEGICGDGAAILDNGVQITITEILNRLNRLDELEQAEVNNCVIHDVMPRSCTTCKYEEVQEGVEPCGTCYAWSNWIHS